MFFVGFCMAYVFLPNQAASLATISRAQTGRATTLTNVQRQVGETHVVTGGDGVAHGRRFPEGQELDAQPVDTQQASHRVAGAG